MDDPTDAGNVCPASVLPQDARVQSLDPGQYHRVYMSFVRYANRWNCRFHEDDILKTLISKRLVFTPERIYEVGRRGNALRSIEAHEALDAAIAIGRGGIWLQLTQEQYSALRTWAGTA